jgi:hypothetical protein
VYDSLHTQRGAREGKVSSGYHITDLRLEDRLPTFNPFRITMAPADNSNITIKYASFADNTFTNLAIANFSTVRKKFNNGGPLPFGVPNTLFATSQTVNITRVRFVNVSFAGIPMGELIYNSDIFTIGPNSSLSDVTIDGVPVVPPQ